MSRSKFTKVGYINDHLMPCRLEKPDFYLMKLLERLPGIGNAINADEQFFEIKPKVDVVERALGGHRHSAPFALTGVMPRSEPFKKSGQAIDADFEEGTRQGMNAASAFFANGPVKFDRGEIAQKSINIFQMPAKEFIKECILCAGMIISIPPEPIAALCDVNFAPGFL